MPSLRAHLEQVATAPDSRPTLPRSGASAVVLGDKVIMLAGYDEDNRKQKDADAADAAPAAPPKRNATNDAFAFCTREQKWRQLQPVAVEGELPTPRLAAGAVELSGRAHLIGGWAAGQQGADAFLSDVWRLSPPSEGAAPSSSSAAATTGQQQQQQWAWQRLELAPGSLEALGGGGVSRFAAVAVSPTRAILHTHRCSDHVVALDVAPSPSSSSARLSRVPVLPDPEHGCPPSRGLQSLTLVGGRRLLVFGGAPQKGGMLGDLWALDGDFSAAGVGDEGGSSSSGSSPPLQWTRLWAGASDEQGGDGPHVRCSHVAADVRGGLFVLGGSYYTEQGSLCPLDDAWWFDVEGGKGWQRVALASGGGDSGSPPAARNAAVLAPLPGENGGGGQPQQLRFLYHGGWRPFVETYDDTWILSF